MELLCWFHTNAITCICPIGSGLQAGMGSPEKVTETRFLCRSALVQMRAVGYGCGRRWSLEHVSTSSDSLQ